MTRPIKTALYTLVIGGLGLANVAVGVRDGGRTAEAAETGAAETAEAVETAETADASPAWWKSYHWHKSTIRSLVRSSNTEAIRAVNKWNAVTDLRLPSSSSHTDISILRGYYGYTGWRGLAQIRSLARDSHCNNGYCEIKHCHATLNDSYGGSAWRKEGTYCMEMGHCFGLAHDYAAGCMNSSAMNRGISNEPSSGNIRAINQRY